MRALRIACAALVLVVGCDALQNSPRPLAKAATLDLYLVSPAKTPNSQQATDPDTGAPIFLTTPAILSAADVATIERSEDSPRSPSLTVNLTPTGAKKLAAATAKPAGMQIAIIVNGTVVATPEVMTPMTAAFSISGGEITNHREQLFDALARE